MDVAFEERSAAGRFLDQLLPEELEWERLVRTYPLAALLVAGVAGYWLGWRSGAPILEAVGESATRRITGLVGEGFGEVE
ncbi:MAG TPA: hypothetical protein VMS86_11805 [Thermoanaerobaculia bacterium]|nr:hypothetical protein [Thermoanaerobaculia bacterium]